MRIGVCQRQYENIKSTADCDRHARLVCDDGGDASLQLIFNWVIIVAARFGILTGQLPMKTNCMYILQGHLEIMSLKTYLSRKGKKV